MGEKTWKGKYRSGKLTAEEAARDAEVRRQIQAEFPPLEAKSDSPVLSDPLKKAIAQSRKSIAQLAKEANVSRIILTQFIAGERDLRLATAEKLARVLKLRLVAN
jgi:ribosome-binding protein aMBF1 (putative translation factor)